MVSKTKVPIQFSSSPLYFFRLQYDIHFKRNKNSEQEINILSATYFLASCIHPTYSGSIPSKNQGLQASYASSSNYSSKAKHWALPSSVFPVSRYAVFTGAGCQLLFQTSTRRTRSNIHNSGIFYGPGILTGTG